jgi:hypothetical protein
MSDPRPNGVSGVQTITKVIPFVGWGFAPRGPQNTMTTFLAGLLGRTIRFETVPRK